MAMTLRLTDEQDRELAKLAAALGTSKHEAAVRAIVETATRNTHETDVARLSATARERYATLLERLGQ